MLHENAYDVYSEDVEKRMPDYLKFLENYSENEETKCPSNHNNDDNHSELLINVIYNHAQDNDLYEEFYGSDAEESEEEREDENYH